MQGLNPIGAYSVINAIRPIAPKSYQDLQVKFEPPGQLHFCETLVLTQAKSIKDRDKLADLTQARAPWDPTPSP